MMQAETITGMSGQIAVRPQGHPGSSGEVACEPAAAPADSFGQRLRAVRERRRISIASIAETTKILGALLEGLENDDVSRWPTGLYRRAFIRAYAAAIGLDPEPIVREFLARFPEPDEALPAASNAPATPAVAAPRAVLRLTLAEPVGLSGATIGQMIGRRLLAVGVDAVALAVLAGGLFAFLGALWAPLALAATAYFLAGVLLLGTTPGSCFAASIDRPRARADGPRRLPVRAGLSTWGPRWRSVARGRRSRV